MRGHMARVRAGAKIAGVDREQLREIFGWLLPGQSLVTSDPLHGNARFSTRDFNQLDFITSPLCDQCGLPFDRMEDEGQICGACSADPPLWQRARAPFAYDDISSSLILALKRGGQRNGLSVFAHHMMDAGRELIDTCDVLIPVPVHYRRLAGRGFNQAGWLADAVSRLSGAPVQHGYLKRVKASPSQGRFSARQRRQNVAGAFALTRRGCERLADLRVVIVDDVYTTGSTLNACARAIQKARPANIDVVTLARVVAPRNPLI